MKIKTFILIFCILIYHCIVHYALPASSQQIFQEVPPPTPTVSSPIIQSSPDQPVRATPSSNKPKPSMAPNPIKMFLKTNTLKKPSLSPSSSPSSPYSPAPAPSPAPLPAASPVQDEEAAVMLNNRMIIKVRADSGHTASERARIIEGRLEDVLRRSNDQPSVNVVTVDGTPVIESNGIYILSMTNSDITSLSLPIGELAATWRDATETGLRKTWHERSAGYKKEAFFKSFIAILIGFILSIVSKYMTQRFLRMPGFLSIILIWLCIISYILFLFPESRIWSKNLQNDVIFPIMMFLVSVFFIAVTFKPSELLVNHYFDTIIKIRASEFQENTRPYYRISMLRVVAKMVMKVIIVIIGCFIFLNSLKINLTAALTGAGIIGVGLGIAAQDLIKDFWTGFFIVFEDQFAVGDVIKTANLTGKVEDFTIRITRLRDMEGRLITIPNSNIRTVENFSSGWSQVDCSIGVSYNTDLKKAMSIILETARQLKGEKPDIILEDPEMLGVESFQDSSIQLRLVVKTLPLLQWNIKRELLLRIKDRFDTEGIEIPFPQQTVWLNSKSSVIENIASSEKNIQ